MLIVTGDFTKFTDVSAINTIDCYNRVKLQGTLQNLKSPNFFFWVSG